MSCSEPPPPPSPRPSVSRPSLSAMLTPRSSTATPPRAPSATPRPSGSLPPLPPPPSSSSSASTITIRVRFDGTRTASTSEAKTAPHAVYAVTCVELGSVWHSVVRWSDLCRMWDELIYFHKEELRSIRSEIPSFQKHTLRMGSFRLSASLCNHRAETMERLLQALVDNMGVSLKHNRGPRPLLNFLSSGCDVELPTPEDRWWTAETGWPSLVIDAARSELAPRTLTPTLREEPALYPLAGDIVGEVRVEVLEATDLRRSDTFSQNDVYAVFACEGLVAHTLILQDMNHPRWQPNDARALRIPLWSSYATLHIGLFDADFGVALDLDDPLGRCELQLRTLQPNTTYTCWLPLHSEVGEAAPKQGHMQKLKSLVGMADKTDGRVRLRYSVVWHATRARLLNYALRPPLDDHELVLASLADQKRVEFTVRGVDPDRRYSWPKLQGYIDELLALKEPFESFGQAVEDLICYRSPLASLLAMVVWQLLCSHLNFVLSCLPLGAIAALRNSYLTSRQRPELHQPSTAWDTWKGLVLWGELAQPRPLTYSPDPEVLGEGAQDELVDPFELAEQQAVAADSSRLSTVDEVAGDGGGVKSALSASSGGTETSEPVKMRRKSLEEASEEQLAATRSLRAAGLSVVAQRRLQKKDSILSNISPELDNFAQGTADLALKGGEAIAGAAKASADLAVDGARAVVNLDIDDITLNPAAPYLGPIQRALGEHLWIGRGFASIYRWDDPALTGWVVLVLLLLALLLPLIPWLLLLRLLGLWLLGPHQFFIERKRVQEEALKAEREHSYQAASDEEAAKILENEVHEKYTAEVAETERMLAEEEKEQAKKTEEERMREHARQQLVDDAKHRFTMSAKPRFAKKLTRPELGTSTARPLRADDADAAAPSRSQSTPVDGNPRRAGGNSRVAMVALV